MSKRKRLTMEDADEWFWREYEVRLLATTYPSYTDRYKTYQLPNVGKTSPDGKYTSILEVADLYFAKWPYSHNTTGSMIVWLSSSPTAPLFDAAHSNFDKIQGDPATYFANMETRVSGMNQSEYPHQFRLMTDGIGLLITHHWLYVHVMFPMGVDFGTQYFSANYRLRCRQRWVDTRWHVAHALSRATRKGRQSENKTAEEHESEDKSIFYAPTFSESAGEYLASALSAAAIVGARFVLPH